MSDNYAVFLQAPPAYLMARAGAYSHILKNFIGGFVIDRHVDGEFPLYSGEVIHYAGPMDYTCPELTRFVMEGTLPRSYDLVRAGRKREMIGSLTQIFGAQCMQFIENKGRLALEGNRRVPQATCRLSGVDVIIRLPGAHGPSRN